jgi:hypothetical protein
LLSGSEPAAKYVDGVRGVNDVEDLGLFQIVLTILPSSPPRAS